MEVTPKLTPAEISALSNAELNEYVEKLCGQVPCDKWHLINYGSAGGPALINGNGDCEHDPGHCYPAESLAFNTMFGRIGGAPNCAESIDAQQAPGGPEEIGRSRGWSVYAQINPVDESFVELRRWGRKTGEVVIEIVGDKPEARLRLEAWALALQEGES